jgi:superfamily II DNA or RNA helicase
MELRYYQKEVIVKVLFHLATNQRCCVSLATGGGKTVVFSELVNRLNGNILICVHREELVYQTSETLKVEHDLLLPKTKSISKDVCVAMVQTLNNRIKKGDVNINHFDTIIVDECHRGEFMKILDQFNGKVIGFTATPNYEKNRYFFKCLKCGNEYNVYGECCNRKLKKYKENVPLANYYHTLIEGVGISELIKNDFLVKDDNHILHIDTSRLVYDESRGEYTEESIGLVFGSPEAIQNTIKVYKDLALNKKTIIFNPNTLVNKILYEAMLKDGLPVKMFDSNNKEENRKDLIDWFKETPNAILLNVQVFTTGFDCTDVEVIFLNKKTKSVNLYLQMVGRGGRITNKIFKDSFTVIDMGNNNEDFGAWSDEREWNSMFYDKETIEVGKPKPAAVRECHSCESIIAANSLICEVCGSERVYFSTALSATGTPIRKGEYRLPNPEKIIDYCEKNQLETLDARKIVYNSFNELFDGYEESKFYKHKASGHLFNRLEVKLKPYYQAIQRSSLQGNKVRTFNSFINETIKHIDRRYSAS